MKAVIRVARPGDAAGLNAAVNAVCAEGRFLSTREGFTLAQTQAFMAACAGHGAQVVLVAAEGAEGTEEAGIVGWCDVAGDPRTEFAHCGTLAMGLLPAWRGRGWGRRLVGAAVQEAVTRGIERVQLEVYHDNEAARRLYRALGFVEEGRRRRVRRANGAEQDAIMMACWIAGSKFVEQAE